MIVVGEEEVGMAMMEDGVEEGEVVVDMAEDGVVEGEAVVLGVIGEDGVDSGVIGEVSKASLLHKVGRYSKQRRSGKACVAAMILFGWGQRINIL